MMNADDVEYPVADELVDRLIRSSVAAGERRLRLKRSAALASVLVCATGAALAALTLGSTRPGHDHPVVLVSAGSVHPVRLLYDSGSAHPDAQVSVSLAPNLELASRPGLHEVTWKAPLEKGRNLLELPVKLTGQDDAALDVVFSSSEGSKTIHVVIRAADAASKSVDADAIGMARSFA